MQMKQHMISRPYQTKSIRQTGQVHRSRPKPHHSNPPQHPIDIQISRYAPNSGIVNEVPITPPANTPNDNLDIQ